MEGTRAGKANLMVVPLQHAQASFTCRFRKDGVDPARTEDDLSFSNSMSRSFHFPNEAVAYTDSFTEVDVLWL